jgi:hypothetical protein
VFDCAGVCGGSSVEDECDICGGDCDYECDCPGTYDNYENIPTYYENGPTPADLYGSSCYDCDGNCTACETDCEGICGGYAVIDFCGQCSDGNTGITPIECLSSQYENENTSIGMCIGNVVGGEGGSVVVDACGVCNGDGITEGECDCEGVWYNTPHVLDYCEECNGNSTGEWGVGDVDICGECHPDTPLGCDPVDGYDVCGIGYASCGVDASYCSCPSVNIDDSCNQDDCAGICGGTNINDFCGICAGNCFYLGEGQWQGCDGCPSCPDHPIFFIIST